MTESEHDISDAAKRFVDRHGVEALSEANKSLQDAIRQRDPEAISYWRDIIAALPRAQP